MFADSLIDSNWAQMSHRGWTTIASFAVQTAVVGMLLMVPLIYTEGLPQLKLLASPGMVAPTPPPGPPPQLFANHRSALPVSNLRDGILMEPRRIPNAVADLDDRGVTPPDAAPGFDVVGGTGMRGSGPEIPFAIGSGSNWVPPSPTPIARVPLRLSNVMQGDLIHRVEPAYPPLARSARVQGSVELRAIISKEGTIENLRVVSGHPMLAQAALEAVRQWRYRPYILNGEAMEVETQVTVNFVLSSN